MASTVDLWTPPEGMHALDVAAWRAFYRRTLDLYGVTPAEYRLLYIAQRGRCWICRTAKGVHPDDPKARGSRRLAVDHNHVSGQVRGLLCSGGDKTCNRIIGWLNAAQLHRAADYLQHPPARVLEWIRQAEEEASKTGVPLTQAEMDTLVMARLWSLEPEQ
jgi:hypothetical protein